MTDLPPPPRPGPRPLPLHMAVEGWILSNSFAGLMTSNGAWPLLNPGLLNPGLLNQGLPESDLARLLLAEAAGQSPEAFAGAWHTHIDPVRFLEALTREAGERMTRFVAGVQAYQSHPYQRTFAPLPAVWKRGSAVLRSAGGEGPAVLYVPSLVNRAYILDLAADRSLLRSSAVRGVSAYLLDWGEPGPAERAFTITDYMEGVLIPALEELKARSGAPVRLAGYCMGGTLAAAAAVLRPDLVSALALLAAPWDFHTGTTAARTLMKAAELPLLGMIDVEGAASVDLLQGLFASLDPTLTGRKFRRFAGLDRASDEAHRFVELEDWLNDGVVLAGPVMKEVLQSWYGANDPARGTWRVSDMPMNPARIGVPTLALLPSQDRIVPQESARALVSAIPGAIGREVPFGHIGMIAGGAAPKRIYEPLIDWLRDPSAA